MKKIGLILLLTLPLLTIAQRQLTGKVFDSKSNKAIIGVNVYIDNSLNASYTNILGEFTLSQIDKDEITLITSYIGYKTDTSQVNVAENESIVIYLNPQPYQTDEVLILGSRVSENAPATATNVSKQEIENNNLGQDLPYLLQQTPSMVTTSDAGSGVGYTGLRIRGTDASRINVTINGIPLNDSESHGVFWVNTPDFASSLNSIQIQRGVGTSTVGSGAFGASINLETNTLSTNPYGEINNSFGSFNTRKHTLKFGSGLINSRFALEGRLSSILSDGYIDRAESDLQSYYAAGTYYGEKTVIKAIAFGGKEVTYQSWYGTPESRLTNDVEAMKTHAINNGLTEAQTENLLNSGRTYNFYTYENQVDNYNQDHYQLHLSHEFNANLTINAALHYTRGFGFFEEFKEGESFADYGIAIDTLFTPTNDTIIDTDLVRRRWLDNHFYGATYNALYSPNDKLKVNFGGGINQYINDHFGEVIYAQYVAESAPGENYYFSDATKNDANFYLKTEYALTEKANLLVDLQYRGIVYETKGTDNDLRDFSIDETFNFFNPKVGLNYEVNTTTSIYAFSGIANKEPTRADFIDQAPNTPKKDANKPERLYNTELGAEHRTSKYKIAANLYYMYYQDQLVTTGQLNDVGSPLRQNVDDSYRLGIELQGGIIFNNQFSWKGNATFSRNRINEYTELIYDYTNGFDIIEIEQKDIDIALSPSVILNSELSFTPIKDLELALISRYIGDQYLDNTSSEDKKLDAYFVNDFRLQYKLPIKGIEEIKLQVLVNNILSEEYSANGYTFSYIFGDRITENFFYPQALRNYLVGLSIKF